VTYKIAFSSGRFKATYKGDLYRSPFHLGDEV
jgi:hypothetical protein